MKKHTEDFRSFSVRESWDTTNFGGRDINIIGGHRRRAMTPGRTFYVVMVDWEPVDAFMTEGEALSMAEEIAEEMYGRQAERASLDSGMDYEDILWEIVDEDSRLHIEQTDAAGLMEMTQDGFVDFVSMSSLDQATKAELMDRSI